MPKIFLTGCGTLGQEIIKQCGHIDRLAVFSRSEQHQAHVRSKFPEGGPSGVRYFLGDICDIDRLRVAMRGCDVLIHTAAMKRIDDCAYNPTEAVKINIMGTDNVARVAAELGYRKAIFCGTDKSVQPDTLYGATKRVAEDLWIGYNNLSKCRYSICRWANVLGSRGSVLEIWRRQHEAGEPLTITDARCTRMWINIETAGQFLIHKLSLMEGGEIFIPDCTGETIKSTALRHFPEASFKEIGLRCSEKLHEDLISPDEALRCYRRDNYYVIYPYRHDWRADWSYHGEKIGADFRLSSNGDTTHRS